MTSTEPLGLLKIGFCLENSNKSQSFVIYNQNKLHRAVMFLYIARADAGVVILLCDTWCEPSSSHTYTAPLFMLELQCVFTKKAGTYRNIL